jgi:hypothetical protein
MVVLAILFRRKEPHRGRVSMGWPGGGGDGVVTGCLPVKGFLSRYASYRVLHALYICSISLLGSIAIYVNERGQNGFADCLLVIISAVTGGGLAVIDLSKVSLEHTRS